MPAPPRTAFDSADAYAELRWLPAVQVGHQSPSHCTQAQVQRCQARVTHGHSLHSAAAADQASALLRVQCRALLGLC